MLCVGRSIVTTPSGSLLLLAVVHQPNTTHKLAFIVQMNIAFFAYLKRADSDLFSEMFGVNFVIWLIVLPTCHITTVFRSFILLFRYSDIAVQRIHE